MVGLGFLMLGARPVQPVGALARHGCTSRGCCTSSRWLMGPAGFIAVIAGWVTTEVGRQPFTVYGLLRTADSASPLAAPAVGASLVAFVIVYFIVFGAGIHLPPAADGAAAASRRDRARAATSPARAAGITPAAGACHGGGRRMTGAIDLATIWAFIIAFAVFAYVVMDGFDLGVGILFPLFPAKADRDVDR